MFLPPTRQEKKLSDVVEILSSNFLPSEHETYNYIGLENIESNTWKLVDFSPTVGEKIKSNKVRFKKGMILYGKLRPYLNKVYIADFDGIATTEILPMKVKSWVSEKYIANFLRSNKFVQEANESVSWARMPRVTTKFLEEYNQIPLPPLATQKLIVEKLDAAMQSIDNSISLLDQNLAECYALWQSSLSESFKGGWEEKKLWEITIEPKKAEIKDVKDDVEVSFVPMADMNQETMFFDVKQIKKLWEVRKWYTYFANDDILLAKVTPCFENGKSWIAKNLTNWVWFWSSEYYVLRPKNNVLPKYLYYNISSKQFREEWAKNMWWAVWLQRVKKDRLYNYTITLPPLDQQETIVAHLDQVAAHIHSLRTSYQTKKEQLLELKASVLHDAFQGKLVQ